MDSKKFLFTSYGGKSTDGLPKMDVAPALLLTALVFAYYWPSLHFPFISYDDNPYIILNPLLGSWDFRSFADIWRTGGCLEENLYIPLTYATYFFETAAFGKTPLPIHFDNILLHAANTVLLFFLSRRLGIGRWPAFAASAAFATHPLQVEPVVWCMGRKDLLSTFFALLAILAYSRISHGFLEIDCDGVADASACRRSLDESGESSNFSASGGLGTVLFCVVCGVAAMLAKPVMITLSLILAAYELFVVEHRYSPDNWRASALELGMRRLPSLSAILALSISGFALVALNLSGSFRAPVGKSLGELFAAAVFAAAGWIKRFLMVGVMEHQYLWPSESEMFSVGPVAVLIAVACVSILILRAVKFDRRSMFGLAFFALAFLPAFAHLRYADKFIMADRYSYFPLAGLFIASAGIFESLKGWRKRLFGAICLAAISWMAFSARFAIDSWSDSLSFWTLDHRTKPDNPEMTYFTGLMCQERGDADSAMRLYDECLKLNPEHVRANFAAGSILFNQGNYAEALEHYRKALSKISPYKADILANIAQTLIKLRRIDEAETALRRSLALKDVAENRICLVRILLYKGNLKAAEAEAGKAAKSAELPDDVKHAFPDIR